MKLLAVLFAFSVLLSCGTTSSDREETLAETAHDYTQFVDPFIGTSKMGHVFPGATAPFGMVQLSPQTNFEVMFNEDGSYNSATYEYCAGYQYKDSAILGFVHTNLSGTGHADLGDFLVMPTTGELTLEPLLFEGFNLKLESLIPLQKPRCQILGNGKLNQKKLKDHCPIVFEKKTRFGSICASSTFRNSSRSSS